METKRIVDINTYWATIVKDTAQFGQIAVAENPEFNRLADCIFRALKDSFIHSATEYGVKRWESMLQIAPSAGDTLEDRKARILTYLNLKLPYTWRVLKQLIEGIVGDEMYEITLNNDTQTLSIEVSDAKRDAVKDLVSRVIPMNLNVVYLRWSFKYVKCVTYDDMLAINPNVKDDVTEDGTWLYKLPNLQSSEKKENVAVWRASKTLKRFKADMPSLMYAGWGFQYSTIAEFDCELPKLKKANACFMNTKMKQWSIDLPEITDARNMFQDTPMVSFEAQTPKLIRGSQMFRGCRYLTIFVGSLPKLDDGYYMFYQTQLNKDSALRVLNSIPTYSSGTHKLDIGIHVDHKTDADVLAAISNAQAKGWTLTVQWNGTPTSGISTTDLEEIYAKVVEHEMGDYTDENGNRCMLDWGHYVTDTTDYKLFFSIYEAEQYYKLTKIEGIEQ